MIHRLYHTIKHLRLDQITYRIWYKLRPAIRLEPIPLPLPISPFKERGIKGDFPLTGEPSFLSETEVLFLNEKGNIATPADWNNPNKTKLWIYNLHYFDDLNAKNSLDRHAIQHTLIQRWIAENPPLSGNGWEPYTLSLRLVNWIKWVLRTSAHDQNIVQSLVLQADALSKQLEYHILGNHLFANGKALVFAGCFLTGPTAEKHFKTGLRILKREIPEQFLADGAHFELSPMYHSILLWDMLDLYQLATITQHSELISLRHQWETVIQKGIEWLTAMTHPDGEVSFFNDSAMGIAPKLADIINYATALGIQTNEGLGASECKSDALSSQNSIKTMLPSGYTCITMPNHTLIFDHAAVGPNYQPGHAHADTLSIEWSVGKERVLVNSGTSTYAADRERLRQRKTAAHNTVVVNGEDSSEVWSSFRVARRARATFLGSRIEGDTTIVTASHDGYMRLKESVLHQREVTATTNSISIHDRVRPPYRGHEGNRLSREAIVKKSTEEVGGQTIATANYYLHPDVSVIQETPTHLMLTLKSGLKIAVTSTSLIKLSHATWHPTFYTSVSTQKLEIQLRHHTDAEIQHHTEQKAELSILFQLVSE
jgi:uncharacterized heparinase superfamily protein